MAGQGVSSEQWEAKGQCEGSSGKVAQACACAFSSLWAVAPNKPVPWLEQAGCGPLIMDTLCPPLTSASLTPGASLGDPGIGLGMSCPPQPSAPRSSPPRRGLRQSRGCQLTGPTPCHLFSVALGSLVLFTHGLWSSTGRLAAPTLNSRTLKAGISSPAGLAYTPCPVSPR